MRISDWSSDVCSSDLCKIIENRTLDALRASCPGQRIAYRNVDTLTDEKNRQRVRQRAEAVDAIFVTTAAPIHGVPPERRARVHFIPNPVDPAIDAGRGFARSDQAHDLFFAVGTAHGSDDRLALVKEIGRASCRERGCQDV